MNVRRPVLVGLVGGIAAGKSSVASALCADRGLAAELGGTVASLDLDAVLRQQDQVLDVDPDDLAELLHQTELRAFRRDVVEAVERHYQLLEEEVRQTSNLVRGDFRGRDL